MIVSTHGLCPSRSWRSDLPPWLVSCKQDAVTYPHEWYPASGADAVTYPHDSYPGSGADAVTYPMTRLLPQELTQWLTPWLVSCLRSWHSVLPPWLVSCLMSCAVTYRHDSYPASGADPVAAVHSELYQARLPARPRHRPSFPRTITQWGQ